MYSFILVGKNEEDRNTYIHNFAKEKAIGKFDIHFFDSEETSFGITQVRDVQKAALLKPSGKEKMLIINNAQRLTKEAQNALLKLLEEPPINTYIFLSSIQSSFLPTIISRCKEIILDTKTLFEQSDIFLENVRVLEHGSIKEKLVLAENVAAEKENISDWFDNTLLSLRKKMLEEPENPTHVLAIEQLQNARTLFQTTNVSLRMILEHCFLAL